MMKKFINLTRIHVWIIGILFYCTSATINAYQIELSFDSLFPRTWYQKGLESSLSVWQSLVDVFEKSSDSTLLSFDPLLAKLTFAQFCINRMYQEGALCDADDNAYFVMVLNKIQQLLGFVAITPKNHDFVVCANEMVQAMQQKLQEN